MNGCGPCAGGVGAIAAEFGVTNLATTTVGGETDKRTS
jgi:hypothetical protein